MKVVDGVVSTLQIFTRLLYCPPFTFAQTRAALVQILADLATDDYFGLITFNNNVHPWKMELVQANEHNVGIAKVFAQTIEVGGCECINMKTQTHIYCIYTHTHTYIFTQC